jgi:hypothetical protein
MLTIARRGQSDDSEIDHAPSKQRLRYAGVALMLVGTAATIAGGVLLANDISAWGAGLGERPDDAHPWPHAYEAACALLPIGQASAIAGIVAFSVSF